MTGGLNSSMSGLALTLGLGYGVEFLGKTHHSHTSSLPSGSINGNFGSNLLRTHIPSKGWGGYHIGSLYAMETGVKHHSKSRFGPLPEGSV